MSEKETQCPQGQPYVTGVPYEEQHKEILITTEQASAYLRKRFINTLLLFIPYTMGYTMFLSRWNPFGLPHVVNTLLSFALMAIPGLGLLGRGPIGAIRALFAADAETRYYITTPDGTYVDSYRESQAAENALISGTIALVIVLGASMITSPIYIIFRFLSIPFCARSFNQSDDTQLDAKKAAFVCVLTTVGLFFVQVFGNFILRYVL